MMDTFGQDDQYEAALDRITRLMKNVFNADIAGVSIIDGHSQKYKSIQGASLSKVSLKDSFCLKTWREGRTVVIPDMTKSVDFCSHPQVKAGLQFRAYAGVPLRTSAGAIIGTLCTLHFSPREYSERDILVLQDIAMIAMNEMELRERANIDALTGILTRRSFFEEANRLFCLAKKEHFDITTITFDIDHFKTINDRHGHAAGDEVLRLVTSVCRANLGVQDVFGRVGGEEFSLLVKGNLSGGRATAEKLRSAIAALQLTFGGINVGVTASFGVAETPKKRTTLEAVLKLADDALYSAKNNGRNRTMWAPAPMAEIHHRQVAG